MADNDLLSGWKEIAGHLRASTKTAQRWEIRNNLPVLHPHKRRKGPVFASKRALDLWVKGTLTNIVLEADRLVATGIANKMIWAHRFPVPLRKFPDREIGWRIQRVDFRGAGDRGVLVTVGYDSFQRPDAIHYFSSTGHLEWTVAAEPPLLDRNGTPFEKAWAIRHTIVMPTAKGYVGWVAIANDAGWAGCILRIDSRGKSSLHFANAGYVEHLCHVSVRNQDFIVACGENNDFDQSFVALLGAYVPPAASPPGNRPRYRYKNAPTGTPLKYILFPLTELVAARRAPYGHAWTMRQFQDDIIVNVETAGEVGYFLYHFSTLLKPKYVFPSGGHEFMHQELASAGKVDHSWSACREMDRPLLLKVWEPAKGWRNTQTRWRDNPWRDK
jgi:hypothetical protein